VFDGQNLTGPTTVVVVDGLISGVQAPADAEVVDGAGGTLLPGLFDTHAHVGDVSHLKDAAEWGVTTMLDMAARKFDATMALRDLPGMTSPRTAGRPA